MGVNAFVWNYVLYTCQRYIFPSLSKYQLSHQSLWINKINCIMVVFRRLIIIIFQTFLFPETHCSQKKETESKERGKLATLLLPVRTCHMTLNKLFNFKYVVAPYSYFRNNFITWQCRHTGWPRKNATTLIVNFMNIVDETELFFILFGRTFIFQQNDTVIISFG